ncbi:MAG: (E)-4-hydroxy-3-methylbut-2-enyl-diphosphate synthase [Porphyromonas sp.]|nr:(E)-4-hydroxy-3-methylbut-2-enyl-diphosphate synthase [Porphyromonas sp.]
MAKKKFYYERRPTTPVHIGASLVIGGEHQIVVQSMTNVDTNDIEAGVEQTLRIVEAGGDLVRFTAQGEREARALGEVRAELRRRGCEVPLVADIHFNPRAAYEAVRQVEKVRINPGNFYDRAKRFAQLEYSDEEYREEVKALQDNFRPFVAHCQAHGTALRIGVNHGSLSDRIMSRYGDTPEGMVESCVEYLEVCREMSFDDVVISIKASNVLVMVQTVELMAERMEAEGMHYPLHLGVTEAGDGEDGRVKSAAGIGALLAKGLGDTIRVSLSEAPEAEIPVARRIVSLTDKLSSAPAVEVEEGLLREPLRQEQTPLVVAYAHPSLTALPSDQRPDLLIVESSEEAEQYPSFRTILSSEVHFVTDREAMFAAPESGALLVVRLEHPNIPAMLQALDETMSVPYVIEYSSDAVPEEYPIDAAYHLGGALLRGQAKGILLHHPTIGAGVLVHLSFGLLQATRRRITRTEFISCPSCGRTLFDLQETVAQVKAATSHLKGLKIGVMGCIVNGPGEMADADYGYVGSAPHKIDLYKGKVAVRKGIPSEEAVDQLIALLKENGDWQEP